MLEFIFLLFFSQPVEPVVVPIEQEIFQLINTERENDLVWNECLANSARKKSLELHTDAYFDHKNPKTGENGSWKDINKCLNYSLAGENLGNNFKTAPVVHRAWMNSPSHKENIVDERFSEVGVGCVDTGETWICTQHFAN